MNPEEEPLFRRECASLILAPGAHGPLKAGTLHGHIIVARLAAEVGRKHDDRAHTSGRLTVDMSGAPGLVPIGRKSGGGAKRRARGSATIDG